jgi:hypothetical protein
MVIKPHAKVPLFQLTSIKQRPGECGPYALHTALKYWNKKVRIKNLISACGCTEDGTLHKGLVEAAQANGAEVFSFTNGRMELLEWITDHHIPVIVGWWAYGGDHFSVVTRVTEKYVYLADSESYLKNGKRRLKRSVFEELWWDTDVDFKRVDGWGLVIYPKIEHLHVVEVDGEKVRERHDPDFGVSAHRKLERPYPNGFVPEGQLWIDNCCKDERDFLVRLATLEHNHLDIDSDFSTYRELVKLLICDPKEFILEDATIKKISRKEYSIRYINGALVREHLDPYFTFGGHGFVYDYIPKNEIWIDAKMSSVNSGATLEHEWVEWCLMSKPTSFSYDIAHDYATAADHQYRRQCGMKLPGDEQSPKQKRNPMSYIAKELVTKGFTYWK